MQSYFGGETSTHQFVPSRRRLTFISPQRRRRIEEIAKNIRLRLRRFASNVIAFHSRNCSILVKSAFFLAYLDVMTVTDSPSKSRNEVHPFEIARDERRKAVNGCVAAEESTSRPRPASCASPAAQFSEVTFCGSHSRNFLFFKNFSVTTTLS